MMQGDEYPVAIELLLNDQVATADMLSDVEVTIGHVHKRMSKGEVTYDPDEKVFLAFLRQKDTLRVQSGEATVQIRIKLNNGQVYGTTVEGGLLVDYSYSKVVL